MSPEAPPDNPVPDAIPAGPEVACAFFFVIDLVFYIDETLLLEDATDLLSSISSIGGVSV